MEEIDKYSNSQVDADIHQLADDITGLVIEARGHLAQTINTTLVATYWNIGKHIVEFEQQGNVKAKYGSALLSSLSRLLQAKLGKGYSHPNLNNMRKFYILYPIFQTVSEKLSWSHICELITIEDELERGFYENECIASGWNVRALRRQMNMYMGYFAKEENTAGDNPPVGIILSHTKDELMVEYATYGMDSQLFVSKYELYLPNKDELRRLVSTVLAKEDL